MMTSNSSESRSGGDGAYLEDGETFGGELFYGFDDEYDKRGGHGSPQKSIGVGDYLPCGPRMYYETSDNVVRMRDIAVKHRVLVIGVLGSFTPDCWNRHLYLVLDKLKYLEDRGVDYICCVATNDAYTQSAWGAYLGCQDTVLMWADATKRFTKAMGMDVVVPWLDDSVRSKRYVLLADDLKITKMLAAPNDHLDFAWECEHFAESDEIEEDEEEEEENWV